MSKIKTTHVGSLPRSNELSELLFKKDQKEKIDFNQFDKIVQRDVNNIVKKQIEVGIDYISDGEMSKISYATYVKDRIFGLCKSCNYLLAWKQNRTWERGYNQILEYFKKYFE